MRITRTEMPVSNEVPAAIGQFSSRWRIVAIACLTAGMASLAVSLMLPRKYTANTRILMEPPAGGDPRSATTVSSIYLESLRTYEVFASSDDLFLQAARRFGLRSGSTPIEQLKNKVLKVGVLRNTKVLEINATLPDPGKAHDLALYVAQEAVNLNRAVAQAADHELTKDAEAQVNTARQALERADRAWTDAVTQGPIDQLSAELLADIELRSQVRRDFVSATAGIVENCGEACVEKYRAQLTALDERIAKAQSQVAQRSTRIDTLDAARKSAQAGLKAAVARLDDARGAVGYRGERLSIIDPGIVPERPSSPNIPVNVMAAVFGALVLSVLYIFLEISYRAGRNRYD